MKQLVVTVAVVTVCWSYDRCAEEAVAVATILYCNTLYYTIIRYAILQYDILYHIIQYYTITHYSILYCNLLYDTEEAAAVAAMAAQLPLRMVAPDISPYDIYMRNVLGWLETRLAQNTLHYPNIA